MRKLKRMIALVTVAMFLLSIAAPAAFAATKEEAFGRLNALGVAVGDTSGDPMYDKNFTRAEAAAIMVNLSGMKAAIEAAKGATKFKDVPASHWASGVINLAVGAGIIKGYPDGTYKPDKNVSYAEMAAMLVGVLGYTPKLQGTWPSNVIGKAAELGLLDGVSVTDYNAAAVRSNVFLAADNALDVKPLKEMKDGYEEDTLTLMERKLSVVKKQEGTVVGSPNYTGLDKNKIKIDPDTTKDNDDFTLTTTAGINPDDYYGTKVVAWVKDDKVFFLDNKTDASDVKVDTIDKINGDTVVEQVGSADATLDGNDVLAEDNVTSITLKNSGTTISTDANTVWKMNYANLDNASKNLVGRQTAVKVIVGSDGKADYVLGLSYANAIVESVNTTDEKINLDTDGSTWPGKATTIDLKDKKVVITRNGAAATLADLKKGDVISYIDKDNARIIKAFDTVKSGKLTGVIDDGNFQVKDNGNSVPKFKLNVGSETISTARYVFVSTDGGDKFTMVDAIGDFNALLNKDVKVKTDVDGKAAYVIADSASSANDLVVLVKYIKKVDSADTFRYLYVAKFDGTETYYEVTKDTKINSVKIDEASLKDTNGPKLIQGSTQIKVGDIVKLNLTSDNKVDNIKTFDSGDIQTAASFETNKTNSTITADGLNALTINDSTKALKVVDNPDIATLDNANDAIADNLDPALANDVEDRYINDVDTVGPSGLKAIGDPGDNCNVRIIKENGIAKYVVLYDTGVSAASDYFFGVVLERGINADGDSYVKIAYNDKQESIVGSDANAVKKAVVAFKLNGDGELDTVDKQTAMTLSINSANYNYFKLEGVNSTDKTLKLRGIYNGASDPATWGDTGPTDFFLYDPAKTKFFDVDATPIAAVANGGDKVGTWVQVYDVFDADGNYRQDGVIDFVLTVHK